MTTSDNPTVNPSQLKNLAVCEALPNGRTYGNALAIAVQKAIPTSAVAVASALTISRGKIGGIVMGKISV